MRRHGQSSCASSASKASRAASACRRSRVCWTCSHSVSVSVHARGDWRAMPHAGTAPGRNRAHAFRQIRQTAAWLRVILPSGASRLDMRECRRMRHARTCNQNARSRIQPGGALRARRHQSGSGMTPRMLNQHENLVVPKSDHLKVGDCVVDIARRDVQAPGAEAATPDHGEGAAGAAGAGRAPAARWSAARRCWNGCGPARLPGDDDADPGRGPAAQGVRRRTRCATPWRPSPGRLSPAGRCRLVADAPRRRSADDRVRSASAGGGSGCPGGDGRSGWRRARVSRRPRCRVEPT